ncbi:hypothetical protein HK096_010418 [Nowakowskiella sp. JEL0078]|nr:hypothetical protein HK096_010418 [Nowakowskiella sp. JEL0078]
MARLVSQKMHVLTTGCPGLDELLDGGLFPGDLNEISGAPSTGKTLISFMTILSTLASDSFSTALYIDSSNSFSAKRVSDLYQYADRFSVYRSAGMVGFENLHILFNILTELNIVKDSSKYPHTTPYKILI